MPAREEIARTVAIHLEASPQLEPLFEAMKMSVAPTPTSERVSAGAESNNVMSLLADSSGKLEGSEEERRKRGTM